mgnify:CR=1 FL=1
MSGLIRNSEQKISVIEETEPQKCELCGKEDETRPYGPNGEEICYDCGIKNKEVTERQMARVLFGEDMH